MKRSETADASRFNTGACSIKELSSGAAANTLEGISAVVPTADYTLFIHLPPCSSATASPTATADGKPIPVGQEMRGDLLSVTFKSQRSPVDWRVRF